MNTTNTFRPTHRIEFRAGINPSDEATPDEVYLVCLCEEEDGNGPAYTRQEWGDRIQRLMGPLRRRVAL